MSNEVARVPFEQQQRLAEAIAKSNLFGVKTPEQALSLMALCEAEGLHPGVAARDYHIINGRPSLKADAMLSRFQGAGGKVEWHDYTDESVSATFSHPQGGTVKIQWDMDRAKNAGLSGKENWQKFKRQMLRARVISEGIRTVFPGVLSGMYSPEEVREFETAKPRVTYDKPKQEILPPESDSSGRSLQGEVLADKGNLKGGPIGQADDAKVPNPLFSFKDAKEKIHQFETVDEWTKFVLTGISKANSADNLRQSIVERNSEIMHRLIEGGYTAHVTEVDDAYNQRMVELQSNPLAAG